MRGPCQVCKVDEEDHGEPMKKTRVVHLKKESIDIRIDRGTMWGNPFRIGKDGSREEVIEKYRAYILRRPHLLAQLETLQGQVLGCWCKPKACHGDVLAELADLNIDKLDHEYDARECRSVIRREKRP